MKLHHLLAVLCVVLLICFGTLLVVHFNQSGQILALENRLSAMTAERDQLVAENEELNADLADHTTDIHNLKTVYNNLSNEYTSLLDYLESVYERQENGEYTHISEIITELRLRTLSYTVLRPTLPPLLTD